MTCLSLLTLLFATLMTTRAGPELSLDDCELNADNATTEYPRAGQIGTDTACLFGLDDNLHFCVTNNGLHRGVTDGSTNGDACPAETPASEQGNTEVLDFVVPVYYNRNDVNVGSNRHHCTPEVRVSINGIEVAHVHGDKFDSHAPAFGHFELEFSVAAPKSTLMVLSLEYRDGPDCRSAEGADFKPFDSECFYPRFKTHSSSSSSDSSSSDSVMSVVHPTRFVCLALNQVASVVIAAKKTSSSSSSSSSSSD
jgi:hypothetical protein